VAEQLHSDRFLSEEDLDLVNLSDEEFAAYCSWWMREAQITNDADEKEISHGVFRREP
jgi:hypothetical protein